MATQSVGYLPGEEPGTVQANREYQEALQKMLASLDARQNRMFDPQLLALAQGFLSPTKTGSFGESLGYAAGNLREAQEKQALEDQKLAEARLGLAGKGLELERQKARERAFQQLGGVGAPAAEEAPTGALGAVPGGAPGPVGAAAVAEGVAQAGAGRLAQGVQIAPGDTSFPTREQFMRTQMLDPSVTPSQALQKWQELLKGAEVVTEGGVYNRATGMFFAKPGGAPVQRRIFDQTYDVSPVDAARLDMAQAQGGNQYRAVANQVLQGMSGAGGTPPRSVTQSTLESETDKARALKEIETDQKQQEELRTQYKAAERLYGTSSRLIDLVKQSPQAFGIFQNANLTGAIGTLLQSTIRAGNTTIGLGEIESAVRQVLPGIKKEDLTRVSLAMSELANIELAITRMEMERQGAITENERAIVRRMSGSVSDSPESLLQKAVLIKGNAEYNIRLAKRFDELKRENPRLTVAQFERSPEYERLRDAHNDQVARFFQLTPARQSAGASTQAPGSPAARASGAAGASGVAPLPSSNLPIPPRIPGPRPTPEMRSEDAARNATARQPPSPGAAVVSPAPGFGRALERIDLIVPTR